MFALIDCNSFYASCERIYRPDLDGKPIVVLSNNDGCVIARSPEAKAIGIPMGMPEYQCRELIKKHQVNLFSSNYAFYGDISQRVMNTLDELCPRIEVYSIDECFADMRGIRHEQLEPLGWQLKRTVAEWVKIPVCVGIAPTKTLAKAANKLAKKAGGVLVIGEDNRETWLQQLALEDVWGIGRQNATRLHEMGLKTAYDFTRLNRGWVRKQMTVTGERMLLELQGFSCASMLPQRDRKENICTSRSFGQVLTDIGPLSEAVATHAHRCGEKLRKQNSVAQMITVFLHTNRFRPDLPQYNPSFTLSLPVASSNTPELVGYAAAILKQIFKPGFRYVKAGVIVTGLIDAGQTQGNMFDTLDREKRDGLCAAMDRLNARFGHDFVRTAAQGYDNRWKLKSNNLSPSYTTSWDCIPVVRN